MRNDVNAIDEDHPDQKAGDGFNDGCHAVHSRKISSFSFQVLGLVVMIRYSMFLKCFEIQ